MRDNSVVWSALPIAVPTSETILAIVKIMVKNEVPSATVLAVISELEAMDEAQRAENEARRQEVDAVLRYTLKEQISG